MKNNIKSILVFNDEPTLMECLHGILIDEGYKVYTAESVQKIFRVLPQTKIDVVLLSIYTLGIDGISILKKIKAKHPSVKVITISVYSTPEYIQCVLSNGASDFLTMPLSFDKLVYSIKKVATKGKKIYRVKKGRKIPAAFYRSISLYPEQKEILAYLKDFCSDRFFRLIIAQEFIDILAIPQFIAIIDPLMIKKKEWYILFDYLTEASTTHERYILLSSLKQTQIPENLRHFFKITSDKNEINKYVLHCNKKALRIMNSNQKSTHLQHRRQDALLAFKYEGLKRRVFIEKLAKYYNVGVRTINNDFKKYINLPEQ